jgi:hypothetical protein
MNRSFLNVTASDVNRGAALTKSRPPYKAEIAAPPTPLRSPREEVDPQISQIAPTNCGPQRAKKKSSHGPTRMLTEAEQKRLKRQGAETAKAKQRLPSVCSVLSVVPLPFRLLSVCSAPEICAICEICGSLFRRFGAIVHLR